VSPAVVVAVEDVEDEEVAVVVIVTARLVSSKKTLKVSFERSLI
jgi:hypothetical protein